MIKNACSKQWKISGHPLFFRASACKMPYNSWTWKVYSIQWKIPGCPLFFRPSTGYSGHLNNKKCLFNTVKIIRAILFFMARASCSKIMNVKSIFHKWWLLFVRAWSLLVVRSIDCCSCPEPSCSSVERLSFIEAWVTTALWPKCSCCLVFSYVLCIVWAGCFCRTTIVMTIFWSLVCWNSNILAGYLHQ